MSNQLEVPRCSYCSWPKTDCEGHECTCTLGRDPYCDIHGGERWV